MEVTRARQRQTPFVSLRIKLVVGFTLIFTLVSSITFYWFYQFSTHRVLAEIESQMIDTLHGAMSHIDGDEFAALATDAEIGASGLPDDDPRYQNHQRWLETVHEVEPRALPYSFIKGEEPYEVLWIGDIFRSIQPPDQTLFRESYVAHPELTKLYQGFDRFTVDLEPRPDQWGTWVSAFGPIRNMQGEVVGGLGIDYSANHLVEVQQTIRNRVLVAFVFTYAGLFILVWLVSNAFTRSIANLQRIATSIGEGEYEQDFTGLIHYNFPDEIATLSEVFELMVGKVREREEHLKQQVAELTIVVDETRRQQQVSEIVESDFFQDLRAKANRLRQQNIKPDVENIDPTAEHSDERGSSLLVQEESRLVDKYETLHQTIEDLPQVAGITPMDILKLPEPVDLLLRTLIRQGSMTVENLATLLDLKIEQAQYVGERLVAKGYLRTESQDQSTAESGKGQVYRIYYARMRGQNIPSELL